jgi:hypothetical protein
LVFGKPGGCYTVTAVEGKDGMEIGKVPDNHFFGIARCDDHSPIWGYVYIINLTGFSKVSLLTPGSGQPAEVKQYC